MDQEQEQEESQELGEVSVEAADEGSEEVSEDDAQTPPPKRGRGRPARPAASATGPRSNPRPVANVVKKAASVGSKPASAQKRALEDVGLGDADKTIKKARSSNRPQHRLNYEAEEIDFSNDIAHLNIDKMYHLGSKWILQGGVVSFEKGGEMEVLYFRKPASSEENEEVKFNIPARVLFPLMDSLAALAKDSNLPRP